MVLSALGSTGMKVSPLGLGSVKFGRNQGVKYPHAFALPSDKEVRYLLDLAWDLGINLLDTAPAYGSSEERLGQLLDRRRDWIIVTKVGENFSESGSHFDFSAKATRLSVERSLQRLRVECLDIVLIHSDGDDVRILEQEAVLETLLEMKTAGLIRAVGLSGKTEAGGLQALAHTDVVMVTHNPLYQEERSVIRAAEQQNKGVLIKKGLLSGHLQQLSTEDPVQSALNMIFSEPGVGSVVMGTLNPDHLRANVAAVQQLLG